MRSIDRSVYAGKNQNEYEPGKREYAEIENIQKLLRISHRYSCSGRNQDGDFLGKEVVPFKIKKMAERFLSRCTSSHKNLDFSMKSKRLKQDLSQVLS